MSEELSGYKHEAVHASYMVLSMFEEFVATSPHTIENKSLKEKADKITELLLDFYNSAFTTEAKP